MRMEAERGPPTIAMTFDACGGKTDHRILRVLVEQRIPATIFVTSIWMRRNPQELATLLANRDLFEIENHGRHHVPAIDISASLFGLRAAGSAVAVKREVTEGREDIAKQTGRVPSWFRGAAAVYTHSSLTAIEAMGMRIAGYSIAGDGGTLLSQRRTAKRMLAARDGDIILAHLNHPERAAGAGVAEALLALKAKGYRFVRLASPGLTFRTVLPKQK